MHFMGLGTWAAFEGPMTSDVMENTVLFEDEVNMRCPPRSHA